MAAAISNSVKNTLMAALPSEFKTVLKLRNQYFDKSGVVTVNVFATYSRTRIKI